MGSTFSSHSAPMATQPSRFPPRPTVMERVWGAICNNQDKITVLEERIGTLEEKNKKLAEDTENLKEDNKNRGQVIATTGASHRDTA